jgi:hypothetical protein
LDFLFDFYFQYLLKILPVLGTVPVLNTLEEVYHHMQRSDTSTISSLLLKVKSKLGQMVGLLSGLGPRSIFNAGTGSTFTSNSGTGSEALIKAIGI